MTCCGNVLGNVMARDKRVTVQRLKSTLTPDASGQIDSVSNASWETYCVRWAACITKGAREFRRFASIGSEASHVWSLSSDSTTRGITAAMRIQWDGRTFAIVGAQDANEAGETVEIETREEVV